jgi:hypothetical protein
VIYSKKYGYIFIKTRKTAGTSIEIALGKLRGPDDIITEISRDDLQNKRVKQKQIDEDEAREIAASGKRPKRANYSLGYLGGQNHLWDEGPLMRFIMRRGRPQKFWNHMPAHVVRERLEKDAWNSSYKWCVERNPWDKVLSAYWFLHKKTASPEALEKFIMSGHAAKFSCWKRYTDPKTGEMLVDRVLRYENLTQELAEVCDHLKMPHLELPHAKGWKRQDKRHYSEVLTPAQRDRIAQDYANEIRHFGYTF